MYGRAVFYPIAVWEFVTCRRKRGSVELRVSFLVISQRPTCVWPECFPCSYQLVICLFTFHCLNLLSSGSETGECSLFILLL